MTCESRPGMESDNELISQEVTGERRGEGDEPKEKELPTINEELAKIFPESAHKFLKPPKKKGRPKKNLLIDTQKISHSVKVKQTSEESEAVPKLPCKPLREQSPTKSCPLLEGPAEKTDINMEEQPVGENKRRWSLESTIVEERLRKKPRMSYVEAYVDEEEAESNDEHSDTSSGHSHSELGSHVESESGFESDNHPRIEIKKQKRKKKKDIQENHIQEKEGVPEYCIMKESKEKEEGLIAHPLLKVRLLKFKNTDDNDKSAESCEGPDVNGEGPDVIAAEPDVNVEKLTDVPDKPKAKEVEKKEDMRLLSMYDYLKQKHCPPIEGKKDLDAEFSFIHENNSSSPTPSDIDAQMDAKMTATCWDNLEESEKMKEKTIKKRRNSGYCESIAKMTSVRVRLQRLEAIDLATKFPHLQISTIVSHTTTTKLPPGPHTVSKKKRGRPPKSDSLQKKPVGRPKKKRNAVSRGGSEESTVSSVVSDQIKSEQTSAWFTEPGAPVDTQSSSQGGTDYIPAVNADIATDLKTDISFPVSSNSRTLMNPDPTYPVPIDSTCSQSSPCSYQINTNSTSFMKDSHNVQLKSESDTINLTPLIDMVQGSEATREPSPIDYRVTSSGKRKGDANLENAHPVQPEISNATDNEMQGSAPDELVGPDVQPDVSVKSKQGGRGRGRGRPQAAGGRKKKGRGRPKKETVLASNNEVSECENRIQDLNDDTANIDETVPRRPGKEIQESSKNEHEVKIIGQFEDSELQSVEDLPKVKPVSFETDLTTKYAGVKSNSEKGQNDFSQRKHEINLPVEVASDIAGYTVEINEFYIANRNEQSEKHSNLVEDKIEMHQAETGTVLGENGTHIVNDETLLKYGTLLNEFDKFAESEEFSTATELEPEVCDTSLVTREKIEDSAKQSVSPDDKHDKKVNGNVVDVVCMSEDTLQENPYNVNTQGNGDKEDILKLNKPDTNSMKLKTDIQCEHIDSVSIFDTDTIARFSPLSKTFKSKEAKMLKVDELLDKAEKNLGNKSLVPSHDGGITSETNSKRKMSKRKGPIKTSEVTVTVSEENSNLKATDSESQKSRPSDTFAGCKETAKLIEENVQINIHDTESNKKRSHKVTENDKTGEITQVNSKDSEINESQISTESKSFESSQEVTKLSPKTKKHKRKGPNKSAKTVEKELLQFENADLESEKVPAPVITMGEEINTSNVACLDTKESQNSRAAESLGDSKEIIPEKSKGRRSKKKAVSKNVDITKEQTSQLNITDLDSKNSEKVPADENEKSASKSLKGKSKRKKKNLQEIELNDNIDTMLQSSKSSVKSRKSVSNKESESVNDSEEISESNAEHSISKDVKNGNKIDSVTEATAAAAVTEQDLPQSNTSDIEFKNAGTVDSGEKFEEPLPSKSKRRRTKKSRKRIETVEETEQLSLQNSVSDIENIHKANEPVGKSEEILTLETPSTANPKSLKSKSDVSNSEELSNASNVESPKTNIQGLDNPCAESIDVAQSKTPVKKSRKRKGKKVAYTHRKKRKNVPDPTMDVGNEVDLSPEQNNAATSNQPENGPITSCETKLPEEENQSTSVVANTEDVATNGQAKPKKRGRRGKKQSSKQQSKLLEIPDHKLQSQPKTKPVSSKVSSSFKASVNRHDDYDSDEMFSPDYDDYLLAF